MKKYILILIALIFLPLYVSAQNVKRGDVMPGFFVPDGALQTQRQPEKLPPVEAIQYGKKMSDALMEAQIQKQQEAQKAQQKNTATHTTADNTAKKSKNSFLPAQYTANAQSEPSSVRQKLDEVIAAGEKPKETATEIQTATAEEPAVNTAETQPAAFENPLTRYIGDEQESEAEAQTAAVEEPTILYTGDEQETATTETETPSVAVTDAETQAEPQTTQPIQTAQTTQTAQEPQAEKSVAPQQNMFEVIMSDYRRDLTDIGHGKTPHNERLEKIIADFQDKEHSI
ncbi:MAG: hypothetical protein J6Y91_06620 [Alphaproteobacteria bacterium]|nr:hypothetical protein [Alphaproteobacteria bacterium]